MPSTQELKKAHNFLDAQIAMVEREEWKVEQAHLRAKEEARAATKKAWREEEVQVQEQACLAVKASAWEEEQERLAVEQDLREVEGPSRRGVPRRQLFLLSSDSARSLEEEERVGSPPRDKGKGQALAPEVGLEEITGVICDLCNRKGIPCQWGKVSFLYFFF